MFKGDHFLTPGDFLESMMEDRPPCNDREIILLLDLCFALSFSDSGIRYMDDRVCTD